MISAVPTFGRDHGVVRYYAAELRRVLRTPAQIATLGLASGMHAAGHALVALVAGAMAVAMARMWGMGDPRSTGPVTAGEGHSLGERALVLAAVGLAVLAVKAAAGVYATYVQGRVAGEVGSQLRLELLDALLSHHGLRRPGHGDQGEAPALPASSLAGGVSALTDRVHEVEVGSRAGAAGRACARSPSWCRWRSCCRAVRAHGHGRVRRARRVRRAAGSLAPRHPARDGDRGARARSSLLEAADEAVRHADLWVSYGAEAKARARVAQLGSGPGARLGAAPGARARR